MIIISYGYRQPKLGFKVKISIVFLGMFAEKGRLLEHGRLLRKKQTRGGRLLERGRLLSTVLNILLFKTVSSCFLRTIVSYRAVSYPNLVYSYPV